MESNNKKTSANAKRKKKKSFSQVLHSISFKKMLRNNKVLLLFSFILAVGIWIMFSQNSTEETTITISDIPIVVELPDQAKQDGYKIYSGDDKTGTVQIKGNRITVGALTKDDIQMVAQDTSSMTSANNYPLTIVPKKTGVKSDYEISSYTPNVVNYFVDKERVKDFNIVNKIDTTNVKIPSDYYLGKPVLSSEKITVTGPDTEVKKIDSIAVSDKFEGEQTSTITKTERVVLLDSDGEEISSDYLKVEPETLDATIQILPEKKVAVSVSYTNVPSGIDASSIVSVTPSTITIAGPQDVLDTMSSVNVGTVDFSRLLPTMKTGSFNISLPDKCINISNQLKATVDYNLENYSATTLTLSKIGTSVVPSGYTATVTSTSLEVTVVGPSNTVSSITADNITAVADLSTIGNDFIGSVEVPVRLTITNAENCWVYNLNATGYTVNVNVEKTQNVPTPSS